MLGKIYNFDEQLRKGEAGEDYIYRWLCANNKGFRKATMEEQRQGVDFVRDSDGVKLELKTCEKSQETGKVFIELESTDKAKGWAYTSDADWLLYFMPWSGELLTVRMKTLKEEVRHWAEEYKPRRVENERYTTIGICPRIDVLRGIADSSCNLGTGSTSA